MLEGRLRNLWTTKRRRSVDDVDEGLLPDSCETRRVHRSKHCRTVIRGYHWISTHKLLSMLIACVGVPLVLYSCLLVLANTRAFVPREFRRQSLRLLLVVAHPDDECLFFAPTLRVLRRQHRANLSLLVFSRGNHQGLGETRAMELRGSCGVLEIPTERCISLDIAGIQDNPKDWWSENTLIPIIEEHVQKWSIDVMVSFDRDGISGHINHRAVGSAVRSVFRWKNQTRIKMAYELRSVSILRKYSSLMDSYLICVSFMPRLIRALLSNLAPSNLISSPDRSRMLLINTPNDYLISRTAFARHRTQFSWDRYLYLIASRYMFVNELVSVDDRL